MRAADVVIVGGGVIGASVAWHLVSLGVRDVVILEREGSPGEGSTGRATGGFRAQYATDINVRLSLLSRAKLIAFREEVGVDPGYWQAGYLWLAKDEADLACLAAAHAVQRAAGLDEARLIHADEILALNPAVRVEGLAGGAFCPTDGFLRPMDILRGYLDGAVRGGARFLPNVRVTGFVAGAGGRITKVKTSQGEIAAGSVVNAAGAWAAEVGRLAGAEVPVMPLRRRVALTEPCELLPEGMPLTIFMEDGFHLRVRDGRVLLLWPDPVNGGNPVDMSADNDWIEAVVAKAAARVPCLAGVLIDRARSWAGLYEMSPDKHALLGAAPESANMFLANGSSGHGVMHAPALGQLLAEIMVHGRARSLDVTALSPARFAEGRPNPSPERL